MAKRRPSGDGMVRKREDGRWEGRIVVGHKGSGDSIFRYISAPTQKELSAKLQYGPLCLAGQMAGRVHGRHASSHHSERLSPLSGAPCQTLSRKQSSLKNHCRRPAVALPHLTGNRAGTSQRWTIPRSFRQNSPRHPHHTASRSENGNGAGSNPKQSRRRS